MSDTQTLEGSPLRRLTDQQVLEAMRGRGNELATAKALAFVCRMFDKAAESNPVCAPGLKAAIGLAQLYGLTFAPGHECHPFKDVDKNMTVASILAGVDVPSSDIKTPAKPKLGRPRKTVEPVPQEVRETCGRPSSDDIPAPWNIHTPLPVYMPKDSLSDLRLRRVQNRAPYVKGPNSKMGRMSAIILALDPAKGYRFDDLYGVKPADLTDQDVANTLVKLQKEGRVVRVGQLYTLVPQETTSAQE